MGAITLTPDEKASLISETRKELVQRLLLDSRDDLQLLTPAQVCGLLNMNQKTLDGLKDGPKRITIVVGAVIRYRASEVAKYLLAHEEP